MTVFARLALGFIGAAVPVLAMAAPPSVTGISAINENGKVRVSWAQVSGDISSYKIFYSHTSILGNNGLYDDFESVDGTVNMHLLQNLPPVNELYVAMLAVDADGEESPYFLEEARVVLNAGGATTSSSVSSFFSSSRSSSSSSSLSSFVSSSMSSVASSQPAANEVLRLLHAEAISATGILLTFTHPVNIPQNQAMEAIKIDAGSGKMLSMRRYIMQGNTIIVHTEPQTRDIAYRVSVGTMVTGIAGTQAVALAADQIPVLFMGHVSGIARGPNTPTPQAAPEVLQLKLRAQPDAQGTYTVEAAWQTPAGMITGYSIEQTTDNGNTYTEPRVIGSTATMVSVPRVPAGQFGVRVKSITADGMRSQGITQIITLPAAGSNPLPGSVTGGGKGTLPDSGPALWLAVSGMGGLIGAWNMRRNKQRAA